MVDNLPAVDLGANRTALTIAAGNSHTCAVLSDRSLKCWGLGGSGQLGLGTTITQGDESGEMGDSLPIVDLGTGPALVPLNTAAPSTAADRKSKRLNSSH